MTSALVACDRVSHAQVELHAIARGHDLPRPLMVNETLDVAVTSGAASADQEILERFQSALSPYHPDNQERVKELLELKLADDSTQEEALRKKEQSEFSLVICEFVLKICSFKRVAAPGDEDEKVRLEWLAKVDEILKQVWSDTTQTDGDAVAWNPKEPLPLPPEKISEELSTLAIKVRLALSVSAELRGDLSAAVKEITFAMAFIRVQAPEYTHAKTPDTRREHRCRTHADVKQWMRLRRRIVALLSAEGRIDAVNAHVEQGMKEARQAGDRLAAVELLYFSALADVTAGKILEVHHDVRSGAVPTLERLLRISSRYFPVPPKATVLARGLFYILLEQNTQIASLVSDAASEQSAGSTFSDYDDENHQVGEAEDDDDNAHEIALLAPKRPPNGDPKKPYEWVRETGAEFRDRKRALAETLDRCIDELEIVAANAGIMDAPSDKNLLLHFHTDKLDPEVTLLPPSSGKSGEGRKDAGVCGVRHLGTSDTRCAPNVYSARRSLLLHFQLLVARLRLSLGELLNAKELLQSAELRIHQCLHVLPSLHVELCVLKLRWRRLCQIPGHGIENPPPVPGGECKGISPPTLSFFFRPWTTVMRSPQLTAETNWRVPDADDDTPSSEQIIAGLDSFLGEVRDAVAVCVKEGGHDFSQLEALLYEALREALRQYGQVDRDAISNATVHGVVGSLFNSLATAAEKQEKLRLRPTEATTADVPGCGFSDDKLTCPLPLVVERAVTQGLARQGQHGYGKEYCKYTEAYAGVVTQRTAVLFLNALRRESAAMYHLNHDDKHTCDLLHVALQAGLPSYAAEACLTEESFPPVPKDFGGLSDQLENQVISYWATAESNETNPFEGNFSSSELVHFFVYLGPLTEGVPAQEEGAAPERDPSVPMVAVLRLIVRSEVRGQYDLFCEDVSNGRPAAVKLVEKGDAESPAERRDGFEAAYIRARMQELERCLHCESPDGQGKGKDKGLERLMRYLAKVEDGENLVPVVNAALTVELLDAISKMLCVRAQPAGAASRVTHAALNLYLRQLLRPFEVLGSFATPDKDPDGADA
jgi:hypothetical protein